MSALPQPDTDTTAPAQESPPPRGFGYGHPEFHFIQAIMEMQKSLGEIHAAIQHLRSDINRMGATLDDVSAKVADLVKWKHMILGGAITLGFVVGLGLAVVKLL